MSSYFGNNGKLLTRYHDLDGTGTPSGQAPVREGRNLPCLNYPLSAAAAAVVFAIIWITMKVADRRLKNDTIDEAVKEEIS